MPTLEIEGKRVEVGDEFLKLAPDQQQATVEEIAKSFKPAPAAEPVGVNDLMRSASTGVPIIGGALNRMDAATNAALAPVLNPFFDEKDQLKGSFGERMAKSYEMQTARDKRFAEQHPIVDTTAKLAGGIGGLAPAVMAAPAAFGAVGTLPQMMRAGAASGAAVSGVDAAVRGEHIPEAVAWGAGFGAGAPLAGRAVGKVVDSFRPKPPVVPQNTVNVSGVDVPIRPDQMTRDPAAAAEAEAALRGAKGDQAQAVATDFDTLQNAKIREASDKIASSLDPTAQSAGTSSQEAGQKVVDDLVAAESRRYQTEQAGLQRTAAEGAALRPAGAVDPASAAEQVGAGLASARTAARQRTRAAYDAVRDEPGAFDPEMVQNLSGDVRARIAAGDSPVIVNPQTTPQAAQALGLMDSVEGTGLFRHRAPLAPVGPVAEAAAGSEADRALRQLAAMGVNPERARAAVSGMSGGERFSTQASDAAGVSRETLVPSLQPHAVATPSGGSIEVAPKVVEASSVRTSADPGYPADLQPRNRARAASDLQINDMAKNLNPSRLGASTEADRGAPIVGPDGLVESGNGRVLAVRQAYAENGPAAARYRDWLASQGVDVAKYREPVLVRERSTPLDAAARRKFTVEANQSSTMSLAASEKALADSRALSRDALDAIRNPSDLGSADNRDFVRSFMKGVPASERAALVTADGQLSSEGLTRVRNAVLAKAYGDTPVLSRIAESAHDDVKSISNGLTAAAPEWAKLRAKIAAGEVPPGLDVTGDLVDAVSRTAAIRGKGVRLADAHAQGDAFAQQSPESQALQKLFYGADGKSAAPSSQIGNALTHYAQEAAKVDASPGLSLGLPEVTARDVLKTTAAKAGAPAELAKEVAQAAPKATGPEIGDVGLKEMDAARKRLVTMYGDARSAAMRTGDQSDVRAMRRIMTEFDNAILEAFENGRFSGDSEVAARLLRDARASHALYREQFTSRGSGDEVGRSVEKILGRYTDTAATPDEIMRLSYGSLSDPGGGKATRVAQRLRSILGETSPEWGQYKEGLKSYLLDTPAGTNPRTAERTAARIEKYLDGPTGKIHADVVLTPAERSALRSYATNLRASEPVPIGSTNVDKIIARLSGRDGGPPATANDAINYLFGMTGKGNKSAQLQLAQALKNKVEPETWTAIRQGMWDKLVNVGEGQTPFKAQALAQRVSKFLHDEGQGMAQALFTPAERAEMAKLAQAYRLMVPVEGTTNPSGSGFTAIRAARAASSQLGAMLGFAHGGLPGLIVGAGGQAAARAFANRRAAREATRLFYGEQPRVARNGSSLAPVVLGGAVANESRAANQ